MNDTETKLSYKLTYGELLRFYIPLSIAALCMKLTHFVINMALGKMPDPNLYISAFSVSKSLTVLLQFPCEPFIIISLTYAINKKTFIKTGKFIATTFIIMAFIMVGIAYSPMSRWIFSQCYNLEGTLLEKAVSSFRVIIFFSFAIYIRCYFMGLALKTRRGGILAVASGLRLLVVIIANMSMPYLIQTVNLDHIGALIMASSTAVEMAVVGIGLFFSNRHTGIVGALQLVAREQGYDDKDKGVTHKEILLFSVPIMVAFALGQFINNIINSALALADNNVQVLATYAIALSAMNVILFPVSQYHHVILCHDSMVGNGKKVVRRFAVAIFGLCATISLLVGYSKLGDWILIDLMRARPVTAEMAKTIFKVLWFMPGIMLFQVYRMGKLMKVKKTKVFFIEKGISSVLSYALFLIVPVISWQYAALSGMAMLATCNLVAGLFCYLMFKYYVKKEPDLLCL